MGMRNHAVATLIILFTFFESSGQSFEKVFAQKFNSYQSIWVKPKLHLVFNQDKFAPGDTAYFKAYFLKEDLTPFPGKYLMEINLVDSVGKSTLHALFNVQDGMGYNQLIIPDTLAAGIYLVTAHNNWMKNFDQELIFKKEFKIVSEHELVTTRLPKLKIAVEGGHLIRNISSKIIIDTDRAGTSVQIINEAGEMINQSTADIHGLVSIIFTPAKGSSYFAQVVGESTQYPLPTVEEDGCGLRLAPSIEGEPITLVVASPAESTLRTKEIIMMVSAQGKIYYSATILQRTKEQVEIQLNQTNLPEGIAHVSLLNADGKVLASRDFYNPASTSIVAQIQSNKNVYKIREKVRLEISLSDDQAKPVQGEFSLKVLNATLFNNEKQNAFHDELSIFTEVRGKLPMDRSDSNWLTSLDNFLISTTEELPWKDILSKQEAMPRFPLTSVIERSGRAYIGDTNVPVPDDTQILFYLQRTQVYAQTFTLDQGKVGLALQDIFDDDEFFYLAQIIRGDEIRKLTIRWDDEPIKLPSAPRWSKSEVADAYASFSKKKKLIDRSFVLYTPAVNKDLNYKLSPDKGNTEIVTPDVIINVDNYVLLPTMAELVKEVIPSMYYRKAGGKDIVRVGLQQPMTASSDPIYIIDGIATRNAAFFLSIKPTDVRFVKVIFTPAKLLPMGLLGRNGIVIVETKSGDLREPLDDPGKSIKGISKPIDFKSKEHAEDKDPHRPDFRSTIHWNPSVKTNASGKAIVEFFCSDDVGKYTIRIDGITTNGKPFTAEQVIDVVVN